MGGQDWIGSMILKNFADQDWIGFNFFENWQSRTGSDWENFLCDYSEHIKTFSCDPILQIC